MILTAVAVVVYQYDLFEQVWWSPLDGRVDGAQQHRQGLVDEDEDDAELRKIWWIWHVSAPGGVGGRDEHRESEAVFGFS